MSAGPHVSISAEHITSLVGVPVNNSMVASVIVSIFLIVLAVAVRLSLRKSSRPSGLQNLAEMFVEGFFGLIQAVTQDVAKTRRFFPLLASFFLFILLNNWFGLFPFVGTVGFYKDEEVKTTAAHASSTKPDAHSQTPEQVFVPYLRSATADLNLTLALGLISVAAIQHFGFQYLHLSYLKKFFNISNPLNCIIGLLELVLEVAKVISFGFRLFGNVFAGEVLIVVITSLAPVLIPMPLYGLEIFVGMIQALVFAMLSLVFYNMATASHDGHE